MPETYRRTNTDSDLTGGADFNKALLLPASDTTGSQTVSLGNGETRTSRAFTAAGIPGADGVTGTYTVEMNVATGNTNVQLAVQLHRVNSAGTIQTSSSLSAEQVASAGIKSFTFTSQSLGTWATGDRLRVDYRYRNAAHGGQTFGVDHGGVNSEVVAPWNPITSTQDVTPGLASSLASAFNPTVFIPGAAPYGPYILQVKTATSDFGGTQNPSVTLDAPPVEGNFLLGVYVGGGNWTANATPPTGWIESVDDQGVDPPYYGQWIGYKTAGASDAGPHVLTLPATDAGVFFVMELDAAYFLTGDLDATIEWFQRTGNTANQTTWDPADQTLASTASALILQLVAVRTPFDAGDNAQTIAWTGTNADTKVAEDSATSNNGANSTNAYTVGLFADVFEGSTTYDPGTFTWQDAYNSTYSYGHGPLIRIPLQATAAQNITPAVASSLITAFNPTLTTVRFIEVAGMESYTAIAFAPTVTSRAFITPALVTSLVVPFNPTLTTGPVSMTPGLASSPVSVFAPTVRRQQFVGPDLVDVSLVTDMSIDFVVFAPTVTAGAVEISPAVASSLVSVFDPTVDQLGAPQSVTPTLTSSLVTTFAPTLIVEQFVTPGVAITLVTAFAPSLFPGAVAVTPGVASTTITVSDPAIAVGAVDVAPALVQQVIAVFNPVVGVEQFIEPAVVVSLVTAIDPEVVVGIVQITPARVSQPITVYAPAVLSEQFLDPAVAQSLAVTFNPFLSSGQVFIGPDLIALPISGIDPEVTRGAVDVAPGVAIAAVTAIDPEVTSSASINPVLASRLVVSPSPTITALWVIEPEFTTRTVTVFDPSLTVGAVDITPVEHVQPVTAHDPTITTTVDVAPALAQSLVAASPLTVSVGAVEITPQLVAALVAGVDPTVTPGPTSVSPALAVSLISAPSPTVNRGAVDITPGLVTSILVAFDPTLVAPAPGTQSVIPLTVIALITVTNPNVSYEQFMGPGTATLTPVVFDPTWAFDIPMDTVTSLVSVFDPVVFEDQFISIPRASTGVQAFLPVVAAPIPDTTPSFSTTLGMDDRPMDTRRQPPPSRRSPGTRPKGTGFDTNMRRRRP